VGPPTFNAGMLTNSSPHWVLYSEMMQGAGFNSQTT